MFHIVLFEPEIPPNTGNVIRLCANTGCTLHLVEPLGFDVDDRALRRAGLDYHDWTRVLVHASAEDCRQALGDAAHFSFSTRHSARYDQVRYRPGDALWFGPESRGLPERVAAIAPLPGRVRIPMVAASRSINLSNAVAIAAYEALRQQDFVFPA
jgi:tRNA (cytidine/uridine-2'-O-)-methyltransferase